MTIAYDITNKGSFDNVTTWIDSITQHAGDNVAKILVGNKVDIEDRAVQKEQAELLAMNNNLHYYETSARNNINITECMEDIFEQSI